MHTATAHDERLRENKHLAQLVDAALHGELTEDQAQELAAIDADLLKLVLLAAAQRIAEQDQRIAELQGKLDGPPKMDPSTPSGQRPVYAKPSAPKRKKKPGAKPGHPGTRRPTSAQVDRREEHRLDVCPDCGGPLQRCNRTRTRRIEDFAANLRAAVTEHEIHRDYCPCCRKHVEPVVPDAMSGASLGHRSLALTSWLHYGLGLSIEQVRELVLYQFRTRLSAGGLVAAWQRVAEVFVPWYERIGEDLKASAVLHADETGWRMNGQTWWLWCFANASGCYYLLDPSRGSPALEKFFAEAFDGVLVTDFWAAYNAFATERQCCLAHLLRELEKVDLSNSSTQWQAFAKMLRRLVRDGIRLRKRADFSPGTYASRILRINTRLHALADAAYGDADAARLAKRLCKYCDDLFTFLDYPEVPYDNNLAERMIRPAVILRKNCQSNRSEKGAAVQAVLMSVYRTLKLRGHDPLATMAPALRAWVTTGQLPPLPVQPACPPGRSVADG
jgi:transposase